MYKFTKEEVTVLLEYIEFMDEFDDDPTFRDHALSAKNKLKTKLQNTSPNSDYAKLPTIEECYEAIPFPANECECAMFVAGIAECHKFVSRHFA